MNKKISKALQYIIFPAAGLVLLYLTLKDINPVKLLESLKDINYFPVILSIFFSLAGYISRACRWKLIIEPRGYSPTLLNSFNAVSIGEITNYLLPRAGEITRCTSLKKTEKIPVKTLLGTVIAERVLDILILVILLIFVFIVKIINNQRFLLKGFILSLKEKISQIEFPLITVSVSIIMLVISLIILAVKYRKILILKFDFIKTFFNILDGIKEGGNAIFLLKNKKAFFFHSLFIWLMYILVVYINFFSITATLQLNFIDAIFIMVLSAIGMSAPVQGGMGVYHATVAFCLTLFDVSMEDGLLFASIVHLSETVLIFIMGGFSILNSMKKN